MPGLTDWLDIFERHVASDGSVTLSASEVVRLRYDLAKACKAIVDGMTLLDKQQAELDRVITLAERFRDAYKKAMELAKKFAALSGQAA